MKIKTLYMTIGGIWGFILGIFLGLGITQVLFNFLWLYVIGESDIQGKENIFLISPVIGTILVLLIIALGIYFGYLSGKNIDKKKLRKKEKTEKKKVYRFLTISFFALMLTIIYLIFYYYQWNIKDLMHHRSIQKIQDFQKFLNDRQVIALLDVKPKIDKSGMDVKIVITGNDKREYELQVNILLRNKNIYYYKETFFIKQNKTCKEIFIDYKNLIKNYKEELELSRENLALRATLEPFFNIKDVSSYNFMLLKSVKSIPLKIDLN